MSFRAALLGLASALSLAVAVMPADAANKVLKIGFVGVTSPNFPFSRDVSP